MPYYDDPITPAPLSSGDHSQTDEEPAWNPDAVQALISDAYRRGESPVVLCVGRREAAALKVYLSKFFDDDVFYLKNLVYAGLKIVELRVDSHLRVETLRSIHTNSRHAEQLKIRKTMEENPVSTSTPIRGGAPRPKPRAQ